MKKEINTCISGHSDDMVEFLFPEHFTGFQGHFPDQPVLPGVCLIQAALVAAESLSETRLCLTGILSAKFLSVVTPGQRIQVQSHMQGGLLRASVSSDGQRVAELKLEVADA